MMAMMIPMNISLPPVIKMTDTAVPNLQNCIMHRCVCTVFMEELTTTCQQLSLIVLACQ